MKPREILWIALRTATGVCALFVTLHGLLGAYGIEFRTDTLISAIYCAFPFASFFVFLFIKAPKPELALHILIATGYWSAFSFLNWRTCAELGYCGTVASTVLMTLRTKPVLAAFAVLFFSIVAQRLDARRRPANQR
jgi:hypothetical protein